MKSLEELRAIRERMQSQVSMRAEDHTHTRVVVGMATCGIASGARPVLTALSNLVPVSYTHLDVYKRQSKDCSAASTG